MRSIVGRYAPLAAPVTFKSLGVVAIGVPVTSIISRDAFDERNLQAPDPEKIEAAIASSEAKSPAVDQPGMPKTDCSYGSNLQISTDWERLNLPDRK